MQREKFWDILSNVSTRLGIFGGSFDPPHIGHLILASEARAQLDLTRVLWVLTPAPPHKLDQELSGLKERSAMLKLAVKDEPAFELSTVELERPGPHYTLDTLKILSGQNPNSELVLLLGGDSLRDLPSWHLPAYLVAACQQIGVMSRPGPPTSLPDLEKTIPGLSSKVRFIEAPLLGIASREIRRRVSEGLPFRYYLLPSIYDYIQTHKLYRGK
jgi:nicotinate-nucleotide adenylyltransferase